MLKIDYWNYDSDFQKGEYDLNTTIAENVRKNGSLEFLCKSYTHIGPKEIKDFISKIDNIENYLRGTGIDLGGGPGVLSATLVNNFDQILSIRLLELVSEVIENCFPIVESQLLNEQTRKKVLPTCGSFDEISLKDNSLDFAIAWDAMHHSLNLDITLSEIRRVLKNSGHLIIIDRGHKNNIPDSDIQGMLDVIYPKEFIKLNKLPEGTILSRHQNGEHEYRFFEWENYFAENGFEIINKQIFLEKHIKNKNYKNEAGFKETILPYDIGGFERRKIVYILKINS